MISGAGTYGDVIDVEAIKLKKMEGIERSLRDSKKVPDEPEKEVPQEEEKPVPKEPEKPVTPQRPKRDTKWPSVLIYIHLHVGALYGLFLIFNGAYFSTTLFGASSPAGPVTVELPGASSPAGPATVELPGASSPAGPVMELPGASSPAGPATVELPGASSPAGPVTVELPGASSPAGPATVELPGASSPAGPATVELPGASSPAGPVTVELPDEDPYNYKRGIYYAHFVSKVETAHPRREEHEKEIDMSDLESDSIVMFQKRFYWLLMPVLCLLLPINAPVEYWGETIFNSFFVVGILRYCVTLHLTWLVDSAVVVWGIDPEDKTTADSNLVFILTKSFWPFYHYLLPWDFNSGEYGSYEDGFSTAMIKVWAALGWAFSLRTIDSEGVKKALHVAVDTGKDVKECLDEQGKIIEHIPLAKQR
uniref:Uncharacterized protein n=1 Tax=Timema tahoe TaxID=61484 RepID=A0A7R9ILL5_9NEOP|nr:unnamed protein product [Timema tahoe]